MEKNSFLALCLLLLAISNPAVADGLQQSMPVHLDNNGERWAQKTLKKLTLEEKIGQMFMVRALAEFVNIGSPEYLKLQEQIKRYHIGSFLVTVPYEAPFLYKSEPYEAAMLVNQLQHESKIPLIVAADFERGLFMRLNGVTEFPHAMAFGAINKTELVEQFGNVVAQESRALGVQWNFFPVADVNSNPANPIINVRAFGEDPQQVASLVKAYIEGARKGGMLTTAKHFPGHGDTSTDSHLALAAINQTREEIERIDLVPFRNAIASGVDAIMVAHITVPALEPNAGKIATTSQEIVTGLVRHTLGFKGLVVTDAMEMGALTRLYPQPGPVAAAEAAVDAVKAGNDMVVLPSDLDGAYNGLLNAVRSGTIQENRIDESVLRILRAKASVGLNKTRTVDMNAISSLIARPASLAFAQQIANSAITLVRENGQVLPFRNRQLAVPTGNGGSQRSSLVCLILTDDVRIENGRQLERELRLRVPDVQVIYVDPRIAAASAEEVRSAVAAAEKVIVAVYMIPTAGKTVKMEEMIGINSIDLAPTVTTLFQSVLESGRNKTVVATFGSPYIASSFPQIENYLCAYSNVPTIETAVIRALFGEISIQGHLPVTIPGFAQRGDGIQKPALAH